MANDTNAQSSLEERIYQALLGVEKGGKFSKGEAITRDNSTQIVDTLAMHATNWVNMQRDRKKAVRFIPSEMGLAFNDYLRCPKAYEQARSDGVLVQPSASLFKQMKGQQQVKDGFCPSMCAIQQHYRDDMEEWGQIGFDEMKILKS